jgi:hypothetical protein
LVINIIFPLTWPRGKAREDNPLTSNLLSAELARLLPFIQSLPPIHHLQDPNVDRPLDHLGQWINPPTHKAHYQIIPTCLAILDPTTARPVTALQPCVSQAGMSLRDQSLIHLQRTGSAKQRRENGCMRASSQVAIRWGTQPNPSRRPTNIKAGFHSSRTPKVIPPRPTHDGVDTHCP